ncbi:Hypothetical protein PBC10988_12460 [Planctomycetales bacterium 10988]|nr:Hypothetical protein PBC10988_12460 [Planctomycetales bacterium 10988]
MFFRLGHFISLICILLLSAASLFAEPPSSTEAPQQKTPAAFADFVAASQKVAKQLNAATVTVRVTLPPPSHKPLDPQPPAEQREIQVQTGVCVGEGWIVTLATIQEEAEISITLPPDGTSCSAQLRVVDEYSGLCLLQLSEKADLSPLTLAEEVPAIGSPLFTAAAAGVESPYLSFGLLSGTERSVDPILPPLFPCDLKGTSCSLGAAIVNLDGKLVGILRSAEQTPKGLGWTYAIPIRYVHRLIRCQPNPSTEGILCLKRRRPTLGLAMRTSEKQDVRVEFIAAGGPAEKAGLKVGDRVLEVEGKKIRSVYQVIGITFRKEPQDQMTMIIEREGKQQTVQITLGGGPILPRDRDWATAFEGDSKNKVVSRGPRKVEVVEMNFPGDQDSKEEKNTTEAEIAEQTAIKMQAQSAELELLRRQLEGWATLIEKLQEDLKERANRIEALERQLQLLKQEAR